MSEQLNPIPEEENNQKLKEDINEILEGKAEEFASEIIKERFKVKFVLCDEQGKPKYLELESFDKEEGEPLITITLKGEAAQNILGYVEENQNKTA